MKEKKQKDIEVYVRLLLGQINFGTSDADQKIEHLRFCMGGNRDDDEGEDANVKIWRIFYPFFGHKLSIRRSYRDDRPVMTKYFFTFHKGCGYLYEAILDDGGVYVEEVMSYCSYGTVDILTDLIMRLVGEDYDIIYRHIRNMPEKSLLAAESIGEFGIQTIETYC